MNWKKVLTIGLKVVATAGAAVAVWFGFSKALNNGNPGPNHVGEKKEEPQPQGAKVISNLRKFQDTCGKLFGVAQALSSVGENLFRIFHGSNNDYGYFPGGKNCGGGFTRVSSNVIEAQWTPGPNSPWGQQNKYCF